MLHKNNKREIIIHDKIKIKINPNKDWFVSMGKVWMFIKQGLFWKPIIKATYNYGPLTFKKTIEIWEITYLRL
jgi:hypothetical protein